MRRLAFWLASGLVAWTYVGFPIATVVRARLRPRPVARAPIEPTISVVLAAHEEAAAIGARVDDLLAQDYPVDRLEVIVASDGSTDATVAQARRPDDPRVHVLDLPRVGKAAALNAAVAAATGEILVFTDANTTFAPGALRALVEPFADPSVGGVAGDQVYASARDVSAETSAAVGERRYWDLDRLLKASESLGGSVISATGAIYAIRRSCFRTVPDGVTDDFATSTQVVAQGLRLVFEPAARAIEPVAGSSRLEYRRKVRIMTRGLRGVARNRVLLDPRRYGYYAVQVATHKVLRRLMVVPLAVVAVVSPGLWSRGPLYRLATLGQAVVYGLGIVGVAMRDRPAGRRPYLAIPAFFVLVNVASLHALVNLLSGRRIDRWAPSRGPEPTVDPTDAPGPGGRP